MAAAQVLRATRVWNDDPVAFSSRARYTAGDIDGRRLPSYADEEGIDPARKTETFAEVVLAVDTWRWAGVPFRLRSGKALGSPRTEVAVTFRLRRDGHRTCNRPPVRKRMHRDARRGVRKLARTTQRDHPTP
jgi:glucose-6-phosphate 1-dehydrogenase